MTYQRNAMEFDQKSRTSIRKAVNLADILIGNVLSVNQPAW